MEAIENLIRVYRSEIEMAKQSAEYWKDKIPLTYQVAVQRQISYERVVEDLQKLAYANQALQLQQGAVIKRLSEVQRYNMVEGGNSIHRLIHAEKNDNGEWIHYSVIDEITKMLKQINVL